MFTTCHSHNTDIEKTRARKSGLSCLNESALRRATANCKEQGEVDTLQANLMRCAAEAAALPILDAPRLHAGALTVVYGAMILAVGVACTTWAMLDPLDGFANVLLQIVSLCTLIGGTFLIHTGRSLRREAHLDMTVNRAEIEAAHRLLDSTAENSRAPADAFAKHIVAALMTVDAAVLLFLVAPVLLPDLVPMAQLLIVAAGSFLVARISLEAIAAVAVSARIAQVVKLHALKCEEKSAEAQACARAIRHAFDGLVSASWPVRPTWKVYLPAALWCAPLIGLQCLLLGVRLVAGDATDMVAALVIAGTVAALTTLFAIRTAVAAECLSPEIAKAKRLLGRFSSPEQLMSVLKADHALLNVRLARARDVMTAVVQARVYGGQPLSVAPMVLPEPENFAPTMTEIRPTVRATLPWPNSAWCVPSGYQQEHWGTIVSIPRPRNP